MKKVIVSKCKMCQQNVRAAAISMLSDEQMKDFHKEVVDNDLFTVTLTIDEYENTAGHFCTCDDDRVLTNEFDHIREWAKDKGIFEKSNPVHQYVKLQEEAGELAKSIIKNDKPEQIDALGDCVVVLVNLAELLGVKLEDCINEAYDVISKRKGKMIDGAFVKE